MYGKYYFNIDLRTTYILLIVPRLIMVTLSFINDWSLYQICKSYGLKYEMRLVTLASSFVMLVFSSRTFSNTIEMALISYLLAIVSECMVHTNTIIFQKEFIDEKYRTAESTVEKVKFYKMKSSIPSHSYKNCFEIATLCVAGVFNRPTFLLFGMPIVFFWLLRGMGTKSIRFNDFNLRITLFVISAIPTIIAFIGIDSLYYSYLSLSEILNGDISINNFVVTPYNFIKYNINPQNTAQHGLHPKYLHILVNIPMLYNVLGIITLCSFGLMVYRFCKAEYKYLPRAQSVVGLMTSTIFVPLIILSAINHQEPRFLLPITLPIILLHAPKLTNGFTSTNPFLATNRFTQILYKYFLCTNASAEYMLKCWYIVNIFLTIFFGFIHQAGVLQLTKHLSSEMAYGTTNVYTHLVTSHVYNIPTSLFFLPSSETLIINPNTGQKYRRKRRLYMYEYGEMNLDQLYKQLKLLLDVNEVNSYGKTYRYQLLLAIPSSLSEELSYAFWRSNSTLMRHKRIRVFYPHLSTEAMPKLINQHPTTIKTDVFDIDRKCGLYELTPEQMAGNEILTTYSISRIVKQFSSIIHQFGLALYRIEVGRPHTYVK